MQQIINPVNSSAIVIANGLACHKKLITDCMLSIPIVVVLDAAVERLSDLDITPNVLLGDFDAGFDAGFYLKKYPHLEIIDAPDQNKTDLEKAFDYLIAKGHKSVNVIWATGRRSDHTITNITNIVAYRDRLKIVILDDHSKVFLLQKKYTF